MEFKKIKLKELDGFQPDNIKMCKNSDMIKLRSDIKKNGLQSPLVVFEDDSGGYKILDGHHRAKALSDLFGLDFEAPCILLGKMKSVREAKEKYLSINQKVATFRKDVLLEFTKDIDFDGVVSDMSFNAIGMPQAWAEEATKDVPSSADVYDQYRFYLVYDEDKYLEFNSMLETLCERGGESEYIFNLLKSEHEKKG